MTAKDQEGDTLLQEADHAPRARPSDGERAWESNAAGPADRRSLFEDVEVLIEDGKTYLEAELNFQKTRARFASDRAKRTLIFGSVALVFGLLALIGLTVGLILALTPLLTAWGATAVVVGLLLVGAAVAGSAALRRGRELAGAFSSGTETKQ